MVKNTQPVWVGKLRKQLKKAGEKDPNFFRFGADSHKYQLEPPISEERIATFEARFNVSLPEGYRNFLLWVGDGGADRRSVGLWGLPGGDFCHLL